MFTVSTSKAGYSIIITNEMDAIATQAGGAFCTMWNEEAIAMWPQFPLVVGQKVIFISESLTKEVTSAQLAAVIGHEEGHLVLGHLEKALLTQDSGFMMDPQNELEADEYAAKHYGAQTMMEALETITAATVKHAILVMAIAEEDQDGFKVYAKNLVSDRLEALKAMI